MDEVLKVSYISFPSDSKELHHENTMVALNSQMLILVWWTKCGPNWGRRIDIPARRTQSVSFSDVAVEVWNG